MTENVYFLMITFVILLNFWMVLIRTKDYSQENNKAGHKQRPSGGSDSLAEHAPFTLFPSLIPSSVMNELLSLQPAFNKLIHKVAHDHEFLENVLRNVIHVDSFTRMLWNIYMQVRQEGNPQPLCLGLHRNDFGMVVNETGCNSRLMPSSVQVKQIEFNVIAVGSSGVTEKMCRVHRYTMKHVGLPFDCMNENKPGKVFTRTMVEAWRLYNVERSIILFIVLEGEENIFDIATLEDEIYQLNPDVFIEYATLQYVHDNSTMDENKRLFVDGKEVAVVFFRTGYSPNCYPTEKEVEARLRVERSLAIKCPPIHYQLAGCKKIQQELAAPGALERFVEDPQLRDRIRKTFAQQFPLDKGELGDKAFVMAIKNPDKFVLKPQREGGGNNKYGDEVREVLSGIEESDERSAYILMERLKFWRQRNYLVKPSLDVEHTDVANEIAIYGAYLGTPLEEHVNETGGIAFRTKPYDRNEVTIGLGYGGLDTPYVVSNV